MPRNVGCYENFISCYDGCMETNQLVNALQRRGYVIGRSAISPDGFVLLNVNGKMMKQKEAEKLLHKESEEKLPMPPR